MNENRQAMRVEVEQYRRLIKRKLDKIETDLNNVERDVEDDLNRMIEESGRAEEGEIQEKLRRFKEGNREFLLRSKRKALKSARKRLIDLIDDIDFLADSLSSEQLAQTIPCGERKETNPATGSRSEASSNADQ